MNAVESFERDVADCGVPVGEVLEIGKRYRRALESGSCVDWMELYVGTFVTLLRRAHYARAASVDAARRLLDLLGDDLGVQLFDASARRQLERSIL
jgi:hypothetical protein